MSKRDRKAFFKVFALEDKTVILAMPTRKPHPKSLRGNEIDGDGVWCWFLEAHGDVEGYKQEVRHLVYSTVANKINVRQAIREQVEGKLLDLAKHVAALKEQLDRIERRIDGLSPQ